jgi:DNA-binding NtrC family response regulator
MNIAIIDDQVDIRYAVEKMLSNKGHTCYGFHGNEEDLIEGIEVFDIDLIILDMMLGDSLTGLDVLERIKNASYQIPTILITAYTTPSNLISAAKSGIVDIIEKPFGTNDLLEVVNKYKKEDKKEKPFLLENDNEEFIGSFETMKKIYNKIGIAAKSDVTVSIFGETGTGKELVAKLIHQNSVRQSHPFVAVNCAAIPEEKFETLFFGENNQTGYANSVGKGTLFLDELSDLKPSLQSKLLRFLELRTFILMGKEMEFKGRIICACSENPKELVEKKLFRNDLYHRISMLEIELPSLYERKEDTKDLVLHFIKLANIELNTKIKGINENAIEFLKNHKFSGNIRELKNTIYKAILSARHDKITLEDIKNILHSFENSSQFSIEDICKNIVNIYGVENSKNIFENVEKGILKELISRCKNISALAKYMNISRNTLKSKIEKYDI